MLAGLTIQNVVIIERLIIEFKRGLCALTGETGAGKSILLDSLGLALGSRAESALVRKGADQASVTALFEVPDHHPVFTFIKEQGLQAENPLMLRRSLTADGRSRAYINDQPVSIGLLKQTGEYLVEIHGQFDTQGLMDPATHRAILDEYASLDGALEPCWQQWQKAVRELDDLQNTAKTAREQEEYLRASLHDLDALEPKAGEEEELAALRDQLMHREKVLEALNTAYHALNGEHDPVRAAASALDRVAGKIGESGQDVISALDRAAAEIAEAVSAIQSLSSDLEHSEHNLETIDDRLFSLRAQARKHHCAVDDLAAIREELASRLNRIEHADDLLAAKMKEAQTLRQTYITQATALSAKRRQAAQKLDALVQAELPPLKLDRARFETKVEEQAEEAWGPHGIDKVRFLVATNPGAQAGPLNKIASGGEMSRFMLALKVVMAETGLAETLIFDEVDAGIGGGTADAVGERLARLAADKQILVVTHSPQVASRAAHHWIVRKDGKDSVTTSVVALPEFNDRREEIARMLSGASITEEARAAADKLLESVRAA